MIVLPAPSIRTFYSRRFFLLASLPSLMGSAATIVLVPHPVDAIAVVASLVYVALMVERMVRREEFTDRQYNVRYVAMILMGMAVGAGDVLVLEQDHILYLPIVMGILYINVNAILRSTFLRWANVVYMATPLIPLLLQERSHAATYLGVLVLLMAITWASNLLYHVNATVLEASSRELDLLRTVFRLSNSLVQHDIRNELQKMQILATARYRQDPALFLDAFSDFTENIEMILETRPFESRSLVRPRDLLDRLSHLTQDPGIRFEAKFEVDCLVPANRNLLYSTFKNLLDNSIEAAKAAGRVCPVRLVQRPGELVFEDECGGFSTDSIGKGSTRKTGGGHGIFLRTLLDPTAEAIFGFRAAVVNTGVGTRVTLNYPQEPPDHLDHEDPGGTRR